MPKKQTTLLVIHFFQIDLVIFVHRLKDKRFTVYEDERDANVTYVSICGLQSQSNNGKMKAEQSSQITDKSYETHNSHDE